jgi:Glycosyltransferase 61
MQKAVNVTVVSSIAALDFQIQRYDLYQSQGMTNLTPLNFPVSNVRKMQRYTYLYLMLLIFVYVSIIGMSEIQVKHFWNLEEHIRVLGQSPIIPSQRFNDGTKNRLISKLVRSRTDRVHSAFSKTSSSDKLIPTLVSRRNETQRNLDYQECAYNQPYPRPRNSCTADSRTKIPYCQIENLQVNVDQITMKAMGGERLDTVMGQKEEHEFPQYQPGAFIAETSWNVSRDRSNFFYLSDVVSSLVVRDSKSTTKQKLCSQRVSGQTLMITRYEYCNTYHTMTDWFNAFLALSEPRFNNVTIVFLDGHPEGKLDEVWKHLWGPVHYVKQLPLGGVCYDHVTFIPPGYSSVLWPRGRSFAGLPPPCPSMMEAFVQFFVEGYGLQDVSRQIGRITVIDRIPYIAHPRSKPDQAERLIQNFEQLAQDLRDNVKLKNGDNVVVKVVRFEEMTFKEQLQSIRESHILIGNHGAGISHLVFLQDDTFVLEFSSGPSQMFSDFASWKPKIEHILLSPLIGTRISPKTIHKEVIPKVLKLLSRDEKES